MFATNWEVLDMIGLNPSMAVPVVYLAMLILCMWVTLDEVNRQNLSPARHAANEYGDWVKIVTRIRLSHKPRGLSSIERVAVQ